MEFINKLSGDYAFVLADGKKRTFVATRDPIGVCPLYWGKSQGIHNHISSLILTLMMFRWWILVCFRDESIDR